LTARAHFVATGSVPAIAEEILQKFGDISVAPEPTEDILISLVPEAIGLIVRGGTLVSRKVVEAGKCLRVIGRSGVGYENVDVAAATELGIPVVYTPGAGFNAVAEGALAFMLALAKRLPDLDRITKGGQWKDREGVRIEDLHGATLGVIGFGRIGQQLARLVGSLTMRILTFDPYIGKEVAATVGAEIVGLDYLFSQSDFIVLSAPLTTETRGIVSRRNLDCVKPTAILINVSRGDLLESLDLVYEALQSRKLAAVGLDVYPHEPPDVSHPIFSHPNVLCTPHVLGLSVRSKENIFRVMSEGMADVLEGKRPANVVNPEVFVGGAR
jgi:D-3-phosphoglycerate dehydrogenase / 2-oxoglutarate reductase